MMPLAIVLAAIVIALIRGGSLHNLASLELRFVWLAFAAFALQLLIFSPFNVSIFPTAATPGLYLFSMALLLAWVVLNRRIRGMLLIAVGLVFNFVAIAANGGYMPVGLEQARYAGKLAGYGQVGVPIANNSIILPREQIRLWLLTDILAVPAGIPLANVFSIGDVLLFLGIGFLCYTTMRNRSAVRLTQDVYS